jgi:hypothetical protein
MYDKIKKITRIKNNSKRYDIGVENTNNFYANGILVHNCQNLSKEFELWKTQSHRFYVAEKMEGSSSTFYFKDGNFGVCSRNLELAEPEPFVPGMVMCEDGIERPKKENTFWKVAKELDLQNKMANVGINFALQGELIGEGIQGNPYKIKGHTIKFFSLYDIDSQEYHSFENLRRIVEDEMGLETVPVLDDDFKLPDTIEELLTYADAKSVLNPEFDREGVVIRSYDKSISFKVISNIYLLNEK